MKKIFLFGVAAVMSAIAASAQGVNPSVRASYGISELAIGSGAANGSEFSIAYIKPLDILHSEVDFFEISPEVSYTDINKNLLLGSEDAQLKVLSLGVPVNFVYRTVLGDLAIRAHAGVSGKINLSAKINCVSEQFNLLSKDEEGKILQAGVQAGGAIEYSKIYLGVSYHYDLTPFASYDKKWRFSSIRLTLGYSF